MTRDNSQNIEFILLHSTKYGDNSLVLHTLSREYGRRSLFLRSVSSPSSVAGGGRGTKKGGARAAVTGLLSPLNILEGVAAVNPASSSAMMNVGSLSASYPLLDLRGNLYKASISMFMSEVLFRALRDGANEAGLYDWCVKKILLLDAVQGNFSNFHLLFLLELAGVLGFRPSFADISPFVQNEELTMAEQLLKLEFEEAMLVPMKGSVRSSLIDSFLRYIEAHLEYPLNIRSAAVLKELF